MRYTCALFVLATTALAGQLNVRGEEGYGGGGYDDSGHGDNHGDGGYEGGNEGGHEGGHHGGGGSYGSTVYTTVTTCPVTKTYTEAGSTYCVTELTTSTIVVTDCKDCATTVHGPDVTKTEHEVEYTTLTSLCPITETKTIDGKTTTVTYTSIVETVVPIDSTVYNTAYGPDVTKTEEATQYHTKTTVCPVTETKTIDGKETTITYTTTKETVVALQSTVVDVVKEPDVTKVEEATQYHTKTTVCPVTETKTVEGKEITVTYTTTKETIIALKTTVVDVVKAPDVTKTKVDVALQTVTSLCPVTETKTVNGEVVTKVYTTTSYLVQKIKTTIPAYKTIVKTVGEAQVETRYSKVLITVGGGTVIETVAPAPTVIEVPATEVVTVPEVTQTYEAPPATTTPAAVQPGAGQVNKAPAVALMAGLVAALAML